MMTKMKLMLSLSKKEDVEEFLVDKETNTMKIVENEIHVILL